ncbi:type II secretion system F family protein [Shewanella sp. VB17]|uniref:type II secretion system F family protein n=1 Tax=Shewanella sp. VB17 TaxID=2739432 RepID=UPI0015679315|nr:type II secretion system F family protein [Shewanella sp. VB17]NRD72910.1 type II secretion system F family protein [Shewanella sp. VB17]
MRKLPTSDRIQLYQMLADLMKDGLPLFESLSLIEKEGSGVYKASFLKKVNLILKRLQGSSSISNAFSGIIPDGEQSVLASSELAGDLVEGLEAVISSVQVKKQIYAKLANALTVPAILIFACILVVIMYSVKVFPAFEAVIPLDKWPDLSYVMYSSGLWLMKSGLIILSVVFLVLFVVISKSMSSLTGNFRNNVLDKLQPFKTYKKLQSSQFLMDISILIKSGVPIADAIEKKAEMSTGWVKYHYDLMYRNLSIGLSYKEALDTGFFSKEDIFVITIYSTLNGFVEMLTQISNKSNESTIKSIEKLSAVLNLLSLLIFACVVLAIFGSTFMLSGSIADAR